VSARPAVAPYPRYRETNYRWKTNLELGTLNFEPPSGYVFAVAGIKSSKESLSTLRSANSHDDR
jgi:hypothetical protein